MKGKGCRDKGSRFERQAAGMFDTWVGSHEFSRAWLSRGQDDRTDDLKCPEWFPFIVSCKNVEGWHLEELFSGHGGTIRRWWAEICRKAGGTDVAHYVDPMLIFTRNRQPVMMAVENFRVFWPERRLYFDTGVRIMRLDEWLEANPASRWKEGAK